MSRNSNMAVPDTAATTLAQDSEPATAPGAVFPDALVTLIPETDAATPMRMPDGAFGFEIHTMELDDDRETTRQLAGAWIADEPAANDDAHPIVRLHRPAATGNDDDPDTVDVELLVPDHGKWCRAGDWTDLGRHWPNAIAPLAAHAIEPAAARP